jgi:hypothetical protein
MCLFNGAGTAIVTSILSYPLPSLACSRYEDINLDGLKNDIGYVHLVNLEVLTISFTLQIQRIVGIDFGVHQTECPFAAFK